MDKNLANYLFEKETLYVNPVLEDDLPVSVSEVEQTEVKASVQVEEPVAIKPVVEAPPVAEVVVVAPVEQQEKETPTVVAENSSTHKMETLHLVVVNTLAADEREFLVKVLMALNMSLAKVDLLDISVTPNQNFKEIIYNNSVQSILFFGDSGGTFAPKLGLTPYQVKELKNIRFLTSASLGEVSLNQNNEKRLLWDALKSLYAV